MADEDDKTTIESNDATEVENADGGKKSKGGSKLIIFGGIGLGAAVIGVALTLFVLKPMLADSNGADEGDEITQLEESSDHGSDKSGDEKKAKPKKKKKKSSHGEGSVSQICMISDIVVNPAGTGGSRFLSASFGFELESAELAAQFEEKAPIIRDALITILSSKTVAQLTDPKQKEIVRYQIRKRVSQLMQTDELAGVYYTDFVLQ